MASIDYLNPGERKKILDEIRSNDENLRRKEQSLMAFEIYKGRQAKFILEKMAQELGPQSVQQSRTITSINLTRKIVKEQASLYRNEPIRNFSNLTDDQETHVKSLYFQAQADVKFKKANEIFKLIDQAAIQPVLKDGKIQMRPMMPHHYDVVPKPDNPEKADAYIVSAFDKWRLFSGSSLTNQPRNRLGSSFYGDFQNQMIADSEDYQSKVLFYWWTEEFNFITNKDGIIVDELGRPQLQVDVNEIRNPIGKIPFVDVAADKDFEFFVRSGNNIAQMTVDLGVLLSDVTEISRLQGFSQAVISSVEQPKDIQVGPRRVLWLKVSPNDSEATRSQFSFESPSPDLNASLTLVSNYLSLFLTSQGLNPAVVNTGGNAEKFTSGVDRFLSMVEKFEASQDDMALFRSVESDVYEVIKRWNNTYYQATENGFKRDLTGVFIPEESELSVNFQKPQMLMNETEKLGLLKEKLDLDLMTRAEAIAMDRGITVEQAEEIVAMIDSEQFGALINGEGRTPEGDQASS